MMIQKRKMGPDLPGSASKKSNVLLFVCRISMKVKFDLKAGPEAMASPEARRNKG